jgi:hypothetical protein
LLAIGFAEFHGFTGIEIVFSHKLTNQLFQKNVFLPLLQS